MVIMLRAQSGKSVRGSESRLFGSSIQAFTYRVRHLPGYLRSVGLFSLFAGGGKTALLTAMQKIHIHRVSDIRSTVLSC